MRVCKRCSLAYRAACRGCDSFSRNGGSAKVSQFPDDWDPGSCPETGFEEINDDLREADFGPAMTSGFPVISELCRCRTRLSR